MSTEELIALCRVEFDRDELVEFISYNDTNRKNLLVSLETDLGGEMSLVYEMRYNLICAFKCGDCGEGRCDEIFRFGFEIVSQRAVVQTADGDEIDVTPFMLQDQKQLAEDIYKRLTE